MIRDTRVLMTHDVRRVVVVLSGTLRIFLLGLSQIVSIIETSNSILRLFICWWSSRFNSGYKMKSNASDDEIESFISAVTDIINNQRVSKILVGDKHQQIYAFRGAVNAMTKIDSTVTFYLTKVRRNETKWNETKRIFALFFSSVISFRLRNRVSFEFNSSKFVWRKEIFDRKFENQSVFLIEFRWKFSSVGFIDGRSASNETIDDEQKAFLFRTNFNLFNCAVQLIIERDVKNVAFVGVRSKQIENIFLLTNVFLQGNDAMGFDKILDVFYLWLDPEERRKSNEVRFSSIETVCFFFFLKNKRKLSNSRSTITNV